MYAVPVVTGKGSKGGQTASSSAKPLFLQRSVHKRHILELWGKLTSISTMLLAAALKCTSSFTPSARKWLEFADSVCTFKFPAPLSDTAVSSVLPEPRELGPARGMPFSPHVQMWQWNIVHSTLQKSGLALTSSHRLGTFPRAWQIFQMKKKQWLRWLLVLTAATVGGKLWVSCVTTHCPVQPNAHSRQKGGANPFLKEKKVSWMNKS